MKNLPCPTHASRQRGLTLVEILVAVTISLMLLTGIIQVFIGNKQTYRLQEGLSRAQESGRFVTGYLARQIRSAGYMGCVSRDAPVTNTLNNADTSPYNFAQGLEGFEANNTAPGNTYTISATNPAPAATGSDWTPNLPAAIAGKVIPGTDVIVIRGAEDTDVQITKNNNSAQLFANNTGTEAGACPGGTDRISGLCQGDILVVSDCQKARVFQLTNLTSTGGNTEINVVHSNANFTPGNAESSWGGNSGSAEESFGPGSSILKVSTRYFFIGRRAAAGSDPAGPPSLYMQRETGPAEELVENIENMQILYGRDTNADGSADTYVTAASAPSSGTAASREWWDSVVSARIAVLVRSDQEADAETDTATYTLAGTIIDPANDRRIRQSYTTTITIRNNAR